MDESPTWSGGFLLTLDLTALNPSWPLCGGSCIWGSKAAPIRDPLSDPTCSRPDYPAFIIAERVGISGVLGTLIGAFVVDGFRG